MRSARVLAAVAIAAGVTACSAGADRTAPTDREASPTASADGQPKAPPPAKIAATDEFGEVVGIRDVGGAVELDVDRVDMLGGAEAEAAAAARGDEVTNDYYLVDDNPRLRTYRLAADVVVWGGIGFGHPGDPKRVTVEEWRRFVATPQGRQTLFHLDVEDGAVVGIEEQYRP